MLTLWGRLSSINVQKVLWCLDEIGLAHERREAGGAFGIVDTPDYRRLNPNGLIPVIEDDGFVLWESNAIVRYLADKHGAAGLWPDGLQGRADADRWMDWQVATAGSAVRDAFVGLVRTPPERRDAAAIAASTAGGEAMMGVLDGALAGRPYLVGETLSVADIACGLLALRWSRMPVRRAPRPAIEAWLARLAARPGAARTFAIPLS